MTVTRLNLRLNYCLMKYKSKAILKTSKKTKCVWYSTITTLMLKQIET